MRRLASAPVFAERYRRTAYWWAGTRLLLLLWSLNAVPYFSRGSVLGDVVIYKGWASTLTAGSFPSGDYQWQYPPGAGLVMLVPKVLAQVGIGYVNSFFFFALAADAVVFLLLVGQAERIATESRRPPHLTGLWAWVIGGIALGPIVFMRYDVIVTAVAVAGLLAVVRATGKRSAERAERRTWELRGALLGLGAIVKVWPAVLLLGLPPKARGRRALGSAVACALAVSGLLAAALPGAMSFLGHQGDRGIEVEAVLASPFMIASWFGYPVETVHKDGNFQLAGHGTGIVGGAAIFLTLIGFAIVLWWRVRRFHPDRWTPALMYDIGFTTLLIMVVTSRVLSPQYLVWLMGMAALCLAEDGPGRKATLMGLPARLVMLCTLVSQIEFPLLFGQVMYHGFWGTALVAARNLVLLAATLIALRRLWGATVPAGRAEPGPDAVAVAAGPADEKAVVLAPAGVAVPQSGSVQEA
jgi:hypothetical protein